MPRKFSQIAFTPAVKAAQTRHGSRQIYARFEESGPANDKVTAEISQFIAERDSFYLGTVSANGWPYIQFRGGLPGFLKVIDENTLGFADYKGNAQYITVGNLAENNKAFIFLMDYRNRRRLKLWGRATVVEDDTGLIQDLCDSNYPVEIEQAILFQVEAWNWNCPQHIPIHYSENEVTEIVNKLQDRIVELEGLLTQK
ncbi:pyridoxamine 5'-phosphate oxidase family protein [Leptolyngbya sp. FACHB-261]|uniref:pyridoxamine 5'-phosphate oxidase family protein n=1 Tax=Leptolyngbya sp. FACHB-261 TaxID=2692806 RepID=UPI001682CF22|nr:pyridoxamine 5'-phosphate oxidase family protein [Leptolyngbya sp. FACHB-261]MBD2100427.1 pyridoxamine 5'-phosphate oxidase family protein [Leptolyngbya sp. FACHB-261]